MDICKILKEIHLLKQNYCKTCKITILNSNWIFKSKILKKKKYPRKVGKNKANETANLRLRTDIRNMTIDKR